MLKTSAEIVSCLGVVVTAGALSGGVAAGAAFGGGRIVHGRLFACMIRRLRSLSAHFSANSGLPSGGARERSLICCPDVRSRNSPYEDGLSLFVSIDGVSEWHIRLQWRPEQQGAIIDNLSHYVRQAPSI